MKKFNLHFAFSILMTTMWAACLVMDIQGLLSESRWVFYLFMTVMWGGIAALEYLSNRR